MVRSLFRKLFGPAPASAGGVALYDPRNVPASRGDVTLKEDAIAWLTLHQHHWERGLPPSQLGPETARFPLRIGFTSVGARADNTIVLCESGVTLKHLGIRVDARGIEVSDFGTAGGTCVNGQKITTTFLRHDGDVISLGSVSLRLVLVEGIMPTPLPNLPRLYD